MSGFTLLDGISLLHFFLNHTELAGSLYSVFTLRPTMKDNNLIIKTVILPCKLIGDIELRRTANGQVV